MNSYEENAIKFATNNQIKFQILETSFGKHFVNDKDSRYIFKIRLSHGRKSYTFNFGQSIVSGANEPRLYDVLACLQKYDVGTYQEFCSEFGYNEFDKSSKRIYKNVCKEFRGVERVFNHCMEQLQEIW